MFILGSQTMKYDTVHSQMQKPELSSNQILIECLSLRFIIYVAASGSNALDLC
jgi:hypothetical protein